MYDQGEFVAEPISRRLRIFAFAPSLSAQFDTAGLRKITLVTP